MKKLIIIFAFLVPHIAFSQENDPFSTEVVLEKYNSDGIEGIMYKAYTGGVVEALKTANVFNENLGAVKQFCPPTNISLGGDMLIMMVGIEMSNARKRNEYDMFATAPFHIIALGTLHKNFSCN